MSMAPSPYMSSAYAEARTQRLSAAIALIDIVETYRTKLAPDTHAFIQFGLTVRRVPIQAEVPRVGWCAVGRAMFVPPDTSFPMIVPQGQYHTMRLSYSHEVLEDLQIRPGLLDSVSRNFLDLRSRFIGAYLLGLAQELREPGFGHEAFVESAGCVILHEAARALNREIPGIAVAGGLSPWRKRMILERLNDETMPPPSVTELAELCGLSARHLMRTFAQDMGETLGNMIRSVSIERAKKKLLEDDEAIGNIAADLGFSTSASFAVAFRREVGMLPSDFRRKRGCRSGLI